jgi:hypothetical protein
MKCQLIQTDKIGEENPAEREMLAFLRNLPGGYFVYRELQLTNTYYNRMKGHKKKQPDFVVVSPETGLVSIEVKDWNLDRNVYAWRDQYTIEMKPIGGEPREIDNPTAQVDAYLYALKELVSGLNVFVTSMLAFPRVSQSDFLNKLENLDVLRNPQSRFYLDLNRTLFREDLDRYLTCPEKLLVTIAQKDPKFYPSTEKQAQAVNERLLPSLFRIGDFTKRQQNQERLKVITEQQQRWIFGLDRHENYLLDVAGSGKTNALISKAIHIVDQAGAGGLPHILLTTYSRNLETNIQRIFEHKIASSPNRQRYRDAIKIKCVPALLEAIVIHVLGIDSMDAYRTPNEPQSDYEERLRQDVESILRAEPDRFRRFDYVLIDEIQDFDDSFLIAISHLCRTGNFFFVGDIGQKIYDRTYNLNILGVVTERVELRKSYKMFRTPRYIAELATRFILGDPLSRRELEEHGYTEDFKSPNKLPNLPEILHTTHPEQEISERIWALLKTTYAEDDMMVITSVTRLPQIEEALNAAGITTVVGEPEHDVAAVTLVDFMNAKGLEKEVVFVTGIEDLYERSKPQDLFGDEGNKRREELFSRHKVYVALTRPLERLIVYYRDPANRFISELLAINAGITSKLQGVAYAI